MPPAPLLIGSYWTLAGDTVPLRDHAASPIDFRIRVEAASRAGFRGFGLFHTDLPPTIERYGYAGMRSILADNGMVKLELEAMIDWFATGDRRGQSDATRSLLLRSAENLGAFHVKAVGDVATDCPMGQMIDSFAGLADEAKSSGTCVSLEIMYGSNIASLPTALQIIDGAGRKNTGVYLDIWHIVRGAVPFEEIAALSADQIIGVELNDGLLRKEGTPFEDTVYRRRFCGEGEFDIPGFLAAVRCTGYQGPFGIEVLSDRVRTMPLQAAAHTAYESTWKQLGLL